MTEPFGLMFHHFHGARHAAGQGAITADEFAQIIEDAGPRNILQPDAWIAKAQSGGLRAQETCITFDDALRCQYDIALPVLRHYGLRAFWFIYSSVFDGVMERLEVYRHYRTTAFDSVDEFYRAFLAAAAAGAHAGKVSAALGKFDPASYLAQFPFYTAQDRTFRYLRDRVLGEEAYFDIMDGMVSDWLADQPDIANLLWMDAAAVLDLKDEGHEIGLHSYSHPTAMGALSPDRQREEYERNRRHLIDRLGIVPRTMSHPCNSYNAATLELMREFGVRVGFCSNRGPVDGRSLLEMPREDHANIMNRLRQRQSA